jgi:hypothetical protein
VSVVSAAAAVCRVLGLADALYCSITRGAEIYLAQVHVGSEDELRAAAAAAGWPVVLTTYQGKEWLQASGDVIDGEYTVITSVSSPHRLVEAPVDDAGVVL